MAIHGASSSSSSSSASISRWDVFLSFRGKDTRKNFTAHLCATLRQKGIHTFMDDKLKSGEEISPELVKAIEGSKISIIVLSKNYASSRWCLDELMKILECRETRKQHILPLFYDVNPSEVRNRTTSVGEAFAELEKRFKDDVMKMKGWKTALKEVANLSGKHLENYRNEPEFICEIIEWVNSILVNKTYFQVAEYPIQMESRVQYVESLLNIKKNDNTCMVGILGTGGIGKTTIAKALYNSIASQFEGSCFLGDIRETFDQMGGPINLQKILLSKILGGSSLMVENVDKGITLIKDRLHSLRVLLVLDDVNKLVQLKKLAGKADWFGLGSRIVITTRDKDLLIAHGVDSIYEVKRLHDNEALQLFSWHAFKSNEPNKDFVELTKHVISYAGGLPLALVVLGSDLSGKGLHEWKSALDRYKRIPNKTIQEILRINYDGLEDTVKDIFLDIACFFKGQKLGYVSKILDKCGFFPDDGIKVLVDKSLISIGHEEDFDECWPHIESYRTRRMGRPRIKPSITAEKHPLLQEMGRPHIKSYKTLEMHDLLQEMGREIVRQESPKEPGKRSRLWFREDVCHVLEGDTGTIKVEGILIDLPKQEDLIHLNSEAFKKMKRLRLFINRNARFSEEPNLLFNELRVFDWPEYLCESLPSNFCGKNLVVLRMPRSDLKGLEGLQKFQKLTTMDFSCCLFLEKIPDVSMTPNLESLVLDSCKSLVEVHHSVGFLDKLVLLSARMCYKLCSFPTSFKLRSLESLFVSKCSRLKKFPKIECQMKCLEHIDFSSTGIKELHSSIKYLVGVKRLLLSNCTNLTNLPESIDQLQHLEILDLENCKQLRDILRFPPNVVEVRANFCESLRIFLEKPRSQLLNIWDPPELVGFRTAALALHLSNLGNNVVKESEFSIQQICSSSMKVLDLSWSAIVSLPTCFNRFVGLEKLYLRDCKQLRDILRLPPNVVEVQASGCESLAIFLEEGRRAASPALQSDFLIQSDCPSSLEILDLSDSAIVSLPAWLNKFVGLEELSLARCKQLVEIPELPPNIKKVDLRWCTSLERFQFNNLKDFSLLEWIDFTDCDVLRENMGDTLQIRLMNEGHAKDHEFTCIFPGNKIPDCFSHCKEVSNAMLCNKIPDCFSHCKEVSNAMSCEIDINEPVHLDSENTRFVFSVVIRTEDLYLFAILVEVLNNGQRIYFHRSHDIWNSDDSDNVYLHYSGSHHSQLKMDNLRVIFTFEPLRAFTKPQFFKSCGFHLDMKRKRKRYV